MKEILSGFYNTPPLWKNNLFGITQFDFSKVLIPKKTIPDMPDNLRLGHLMEFIFTHLITNSKSHELIAHNLVVEEHKRSIGELDFILKEIDTATYLHVELAYKFYVIIDTSTNFIAHLIGPNKKDSFVEKLGKLQHKQLPLLHHKALANTWEALEISTQRIEQQCCFKAQLFTPFKSNITSVDSLNTECIQGSWISFSEFNTSIFLSAQFYLLSKREWVIQPQENVAWVSYEKIVFDIQLLHQKERSPMLWMKNKTGRISKLFVVWW